MIDLDALEKKARTDGFINMNVDRLDVLELIERLKSAEDVLKQVESGPVYIDGNKAKTRARAHLERFK